MATTVAALVANPRIVFFAVFVLVVAALLYRDRENVERHFILFYRRTERGIVLIDRIASAAPSLWKVYGWTGVVTGIASILVSSYLIARVFLDIAVTRSLQNGPALILPGAVSSNQFQAGVSFIPVEYWIIGIGIVTVVHELSHGIVARTEGFEINSVGWLVLGFIPGAFVEPKGEEMLPGDEESSSSTGHWDQGDWKSRMKVLGAGSLGNYVTAALFLLLAFGTVSLITHQTVVYSAAEGFPAEGAGMTNGTLHRIDGQTINTVQDVRSVSSTIDVGDTVTLQTSEGNFTLTAAQREGFENGYIGIQLRGIRQINQGYGPFQGLLEWLVSLFETVAILNMLIGLFNMLPFKPLDGGFMTETALKQVSGESPRYVNFISLIGWSFLITALAVSIWIGFL